jgi:AGZA family xanthine/uracil permease-like MFS transporter
MMQGAAEIDFRDFSKAVPAVVTLIMIPLTFSISEGIGLGIIVYVGFMLATHRARNVSILAYILAVLFLLQGVFEKN